MKDIWMAPDMTNFARAGLLASVQATDNVDAW